MSSKVSDVATVLGGILDGVISGSASSQVTEVINPSNGERLAWIPIGCEADVEHAVVSCRHAFIDGRWSEAPTLFRKRVLHRWAGIIAQEATALDALDAGEMGKPIGELRANAAQAAELMRFYAEAVDKVTGDVVANDKNSFVVNRLCPRGVVAAVVPWNFPTFNAVLKVAPALAAGNCVVLKPSELSSRSAIRIAELATEAGLPSGVFNVVLGAGSVVGRALGQHRDVDMLTFTGSSEVGKWMLQYSGQSNMKAVLAECGGKCPQIVFDDGVDLDAVSESIATFLVTNQGQICSVGSRLLVQRSIETVVVEKVTARLSKIVMGDALDPKTTFGPLASAEQCARVVSYINSAGDEGARLIYGGRRVLQETGGYFVEPAVFTKVSPTARIAQEEIFGPVLAVIPFDDEEEAAGIANGTMYGLMAYVWTADLSRGMRMARAIRSGVVVNAAMPAGEGPGHAFSLEPTGLSGLGAEGGLPGLQSYLRRQLIWINHA